MAVTMLEINAMQGVAVFELGVDLLSPSVSILLHLSPQMYFSDDATNISLFVYIVFLRFTDLLSPSVSILLQLSPLMYFSDGTTYISL